jgi:hypothetical protein
MIYDPLRGGTDDPIKRLENTVYALNKAIKLRALATGAPYYPKFSSDSEEQCVFCDIVPAEQRPARPSAARRREAIG